MGEAKPPPPGKRKRFIKLASMTASVASRYAKTRVKSAFLSAEARVEELARSHEISGERIVETLGELKGAVMKVGQMASVVTDILPAEVASALTKLQRDAPPAPYEVIRAQIETELGLPPEMLFDRFDEVPFAAASIGQVHRARTDDGREVVVKVQYPGVDASCDADLRHLKLALRASGLIKLEKKALDMAFAELKARLHEELDYTHEADNLRLFGDFHAAHPFMIVPRVVGERSARRVLTMTYEPGDSLGLVADQYDQTTRDTIGENIFKMIAMQLVELNALHADPNPANFAYRPDGRIVAYDFGCVTRPSRRTLQDYFATIRASLDSRFADVEAGLTRLGARVPEKAGPPPEFYKGWRDVLLAPFMQNIPYDYGASHIHEEALRMVPSALKYVSAFSPPREVIFIDRTVIGHYGALKQMRARVNGKALMEPYVDRALAWSVASDTV